MVAGLGVLLLIAGCSGKSANMFAARPGNLPAPDPLAAPQPATNFETAEFFANTGLDQIGAQGAYAKGAYGGGVVVAVIDTGIQTDHSDLDANISPESIDIVRGGTLIDEEGHGTHVAGIIAAEKNDVGMHGVAFDATILAIRADTVVSDPAVCGGAASCSLFFDQDLVNALRYASGKAHVINMSLGGPAPLSNSFEQQLVGAMGAGAIIVVAAGNESATDPGWPAMYAAHPIINESGQMISVGAVDGTGTLAGFSNQCGATMDFCLVAPGVDILSTFPGDALALASGTSMAAPHVSGAAALLIQAWPMLAPADIVDILLTSATDLGAAGVDPVYGHGLLNLNAAVAPLGTLSIPMTDSAGGDSVRLDGTVLALGPAFGDALSGLPLLGQAIALDGYDRNYVAGLQGHVVRAGRGFGMESLTAGTGVDMIGSALPNGATVSMGLVDHSSAESAADWSGMAADAAPERQVRGVSLAMTGADGTSWRFGYDMTPDQLVPDRAVEPATSLFWMSGDLLGPNHTLVGAGTAVSASRSLGAGNVISLGMIDQSEGTEAVAGDARMGEVALTRRFAGGAVLTAGFSDVDEREGFLGSGAGGGFAVEGANSRFYVLGGRVPIGAGAELLGSYTLARTDMVADGTSLLSDWSGARADAFGIGIVKHDVPGTGGRIGLLAGQPLRVNSASARLTLPVGYDLDKTVVQESERVSLVPTGREIDVQLAYDKSVGARGNFSGWLMMQMEPGHDADAAPAYALGLRFGTSF